MMRVLLMHNPKAGEGGDSPAALIEMLREEGYDPTYQSTKEDDFTRRLRESWDLVIVAGGDGAVAEVADAMEDGEQPLAILPLGTANNLARSLGIGGDTRNILQRLRHPRVSSVRPAIAAGGWGRRTIWEGVGVGLFPRVIRRASEPGGKPAAEAGDDGLAPALRLWAAELSSAPAIPLRAFVDDHRIAGDFIMAEVSIVSMIGPNLPLLPVADPTDGRLDLLLIAAADRQRLLDYLHARIEGHAPQSPPALPLLSGRSVRIECPDSPVRLDDELWPPRDSSETGSCGDEGAGVIAVDLGGPARTVWLPGGPEDS